MNFLYRIRAALSRLMAGRYGQDQLGLCILILAVVCSFFSGFASMGFLILPAYALLIYGIYRMFSKKIAARRRENDWFLGIWNRIKNWLRRKKANSADSKYYRHFKCPKCKMKLRAPKGKGHIRVTCPSCKEMFETKV